jgi:hypothetical protein
VARHSSDYLLAGLIATVNLDLVGKIRSMHWPAVEAP